VSRTLAVFISVLSIPPLHRAKNWPSPPPLSSPLRRQALVGLPKKSQHLSARSRSLAAIFPGLKYRTASSFLLPIWSPLFPFALLDCMRPSVLSCSRDTRSTRVCFQRDVTILSANVLERDGVLISQRTYPTWPYISSSDQQPQARVERPFVRTVFAEYST
jgi:hypothetical protein